MGRRRKKRITYDSNEIKTLFGIAFIIASIVALLSNFTDGILFLFMRSQFGGATILFSFFFLIVALKMFNVKPEKITWRSILGSFLISISWAIFLSGNTGLDLDAAEQARLGEYGGMIGYKGAEIVGNLLWRNFVKPIMIFIIFLSIPLVFSMKINEYFSKIAEIFRKIKMNLNKIARKPVKNEPEESDEEIEVESPTMLSELRTQKEIQEEKYGSSFNSQNHEVEKPEKKEDKLKNVDVKYKETHGDNELLKQTELKFPDWELPSFELLNKIKKAPPSRAGIRKNTEIIEKTLNSFGVKAQVVDVLVGPSVTQYALDIALGTKVAKIANLRSDLALALATSANAVRIEAPIPGTRYVGIEIPNSDREMISFRELAESENMHKGILGVTIGKKVSGEHLFGDIQKMPHLLIAGATGSGKSVVTNSFILSLLMKKSPDEVRFILVDPKQVELSDYNGIPHLLTPVITDMEKVNNSLKWAIVEMERRYTEFKNEKVRNIEGYNSKMGFSALPYIVIVIDEMADMMMTQNGAEIEGSIVKLAQKARATGIHLILATQRPSVDVITGLIKANIPGRVGMSVTTQIDSRVILDTIGAESLLGRGDLLFKDPSKNRLERIQAPFVSQDEVIRVTDFIRNQSPEVEYTMEVTQAQADPNAPEGALESQNFSDDGLFVAAAKVVANARKGSSSLIQRKLSVGYNRAARLLDELEEHGIVGAPNGSKPRDVLVTDIDGFLASRNSQEG